MLKKYRAIVFFLLILLIMCFCSCKLAPTDVYIYNEISECYSIENCPNESIIVYDQPSEDKYIKELEYKNFYGCDFTAKEFSFQLFAYQFENSDSANEYFRSVTGKKSSEEKNFTDVTSLFSYRRVVVDNENAYIVYSEPEDAAAVIAFLNGIFTKELHWTKG